MFNTCAVRLIHSVSDVLKQEIIMTELCFMLTFVVCDYFISHVILLM